MKISATLVPVAAVLTLVASSAEGQQTPLQSFRTSWQSFLTLEQAQVWADSASWSTSPDGVRSVRFRTVESRIDGKPAEAAMIQEMDFICAKKLYRVTRASVERDGKIVAILPDSLGRRDWKQPYDTGLEDFLLQTVCKKK